MFEMFDDAFARLCSAASSMRECGVPAEAASIVALRAQLDALSALISEAEVRFDRHELWRDQGAGSMRAWLTDACGLPRREATRQARRLERLDSWPEVASAWIEGSLTGPQVDVIVDAVPSRFVSTFAERASAVVPVLAPLDVSGTSTAMGQWLRCAEAADGPQDLSERPSGLHLDPLLDGRVVLQGHFGAADAAVIAAALRDFDVADPIGDDGRIVGDVRSMAQRNADALVEVCRFAISFRQGSGESGRFLPHVSLVVDVAELRASALRGAGVSSTAGLDRIARARGWSAVEQAWFADALGRNGDAVTFEGSLLDAAAVSLLTCDSVVQRVLMSGSQVLDMGRSVRSATSAQRRAIIARDRHCRAPGCRTRPRYCDVHHVDHWINGGRTDVHRMVLLCGTHHREFHRAGYRMELDDQATFTVRSPRGWTRTSVPERAEAPVFTRAVG